MASNFRILTHRSNGHLQFELMGDFDGSSAFELINALKAGFQMANLACALERPDLRAALLPFIQKLLERENPGSRARTRRGAEKKRAVPPARYTPLREEAFTQYRYPPPEQ